MVKKASHYCNLLKFIEDKNKSLYNVIDELCVQPLFFKPRRRTPGMTFLMPDSKLTAELESLMAKDASKAFSLLRSLLIADNLVSANDFKASMNNIPTYNGKKLLVREVKGAEVLLGKSAKAKAVELKMRSDRDNVHVFELSGSLEVESDADAEPANERKVKGGADLNAKTRQSLFESLCAQWKVWVSQKMAGDEIVLAPGADPAKELLVALDVWAENSHNADLQAVIRSQCSEDTLASVAILLQPYRTKASSYLSSSHLQLFIDDNNAAPKTSGFTNLSLDVDGRYKNMMNGVHDLPEMRSDVISVTNVIDQIKKSYKDVKPGLPQARFDVLQNDCELALAESELRVISSISRDNTADERASIFSTYSLDAPFMLQDPRPMCAAFYFSVPHLITRSDAFVYVPGNRSDFMSMEDTPDFAQKVCVAKGM